MTTRARPAGEPAPPIRHPAETPRPTTARWENQVWRGERPWPAFPRAPGSAPEASRFHHEKRTCSIPLLKHEALVVLGGIIVTVLVAVLIAVLVVPAVFKGFGGIAMVMTACFLVVFIGLATIPVWMASIEDDIEDHAGEFADRTSEE